MHDGKRRRHVVTQLEFHRHVGLRIVSHYLQTRWRDTSSWQPVVSCTGTRDLYDYVLMSDDMRTAQESADDDKPRQLAPLDSRVCITRIFLPLRVRLTSAVNLRADLARPWLLPGARLVRTPVRPKAAPMSPLLYCQGRARADRRLQPIVRPPLTHIHSNRIRRSLEILRRTGHSSTSYRHRQH